MLKKATKLITNNFGLKIIAFLFAVALWLLVVNIDDPTQSSTFTASIAIENADYMAQQGKYFEAKDSDLTVTFKVSANRSVMKNLSNTDFKAVANMENVQVVNGVYQVPITITATRYASSVLFTGKTQYLMLNVDNLIRKQFSIKAIASGDPAEDFAVGELKVSPNVLKISGPEALISRIDSVRASIDVSGAASDLTDSVTPMLYDASGNLIDTAKLTFNIDKVTVSADILDIRNLVVHAETSGTAADGYVCTGVTVNPEKIAVKGISSALNETDGIVIPSNIVNINGATEDVTKTVDISEYLPEGLELVNSDNHNVEVTAVVEQIVTMTYDVPASNFQLVNTKEGYSAVLEGTTVPIAVEGLKSKMAELTPLSIMGTIDLSGLTEGTHIVTAAVDLGSEEYTVSGAHTAAVVITKKATGTDTGGGAGTGNTENGGTGNGTGGTDNNNAED